ncbi:hypothetical protein L2E82_05585 [Cichorium intybus]|uniref:Uncharacterized protein n=1 Tax=Cichorium intybus TaxID=13427 RepID=A0ACB9H782_CICIN|nr:hypothetical protein L2E82_05585 [Cichorium intybus]
MNTPQDTTKTNGVDTNYLLFSNVRSHSSNPFSRQNFQNLLTQSGFRAEMAEGPSSPGGGSHENGDLTLSPSSSNFLGQDNFLPFANIKRIIKKGLPADGKIGKDVKETVQECAALFITFITSEANDKRIKEKRKTINGEDLLWAMETLGFDDYIQPLAVYLKKYRQIEGVKIGSIKDHDGKGNEGFHSQGLNNGNSQQQGTK